MISEHNIFIVDPDGECLFNSVAVGIIYLSTGQYRPYKKLAKYLRSETVKRLKQRISDFDYNLIVSMAGQYANSNNNNVDNLLQRAKNYVKSMSKSCTWGGDIEVLILGEIVQAYGFAGIKVWDSDTGLLIMQSKMNSPRVNPTIHIVMRDVFRGGSHYNFYNKTPKRMKASVKIT